MDKYTKKVKVYLDNMEPGTSAKIISLTNQPAKLIDSIKKLIDTTNPEIGFNNDYTVIKKASMILKRLKNEA